MESSAGKTRRPSTRGVSADKGKRATAISHYLAACRLLTLCPFCILINADSQMPNPMKRRDGGISRNNKRSDRHNFVSLIRWQREEEEEEGRCISASLKSLFPSYSSLTSSTSVSLMKTFSPPLPFCHVPSFLPALLPSLECCPNSILIDGERNRLIKNGFADCAPAVFSFTKEACECLSVSGQLFFSFFFFFFSQVLLEEMVG